MSGLTGSLDPRGFYENQQGVVAPIQRVFNGGNGNNKGINKPTLHIRKAPLVLNNNGNPLLGPNGKPLEKLWSERESPGIGTEGAAPEQGWMTPTFNLSLGNKRGGKKSQRRARTCRQRRRQTRRNRNRKSTRRNRKH